MANESAQIQTSRAGVYAGSFDPITLGHLDIIFQAAAILPKLYVVVGVNSEKNPIFTHAERVEMITREIEEGIKPKLAEAGYETEIIVASHKGLMVSFMEAHNAPIFVRGLRLGTEFDKEYPSLVAQRYEYSDFNDVPVYDISGIADRLLQPGARNCQPPGQKPCALRHAQHR